MTNFSPPLKMIPYDLIKRHFLYMGKKEYKVTAAELKIRQGWSLNQKIDHTIGVLDQFISHYGGVDNVYISFSGGKDSTVLLDIARKVFGPKIKALFVNTGLEFPYIVKFVKSYDNVDIIRPKVSHQQVIEEFGFPLISKNLSEKIWYAKHRPTSERARVALDSTSAFCVSNYARYLIAAPFDCSAKCCKVLKKDPYNDYYKKTKRRPISGTMACESQTRGLQYSITGCNSFNKKKGIISRPLSIWTEKDIWDYIEINKLPISEIYYKGAKRTGCMFCGFGCQFKDDNRFEVLMKEQPKAYIHCMNLTNNGVTYREALRGVLKAVGLCLPDEKNY